MRYLWIKNISSTLQTNVTHVHMCYICKDTFVKKNNIRIIGQDYRDEIKSV